MKKDHRCSGFSLVELMAASAAAAVLLVTALVLLNYEATFWGQSTLDVGMRRDADAAMNLLAHKIHAASYTNITVTSNSLVISAATFQRSGQSLNFTPTTGGKATLLISNTVTAFVPVLTNNLIQINLCVTNGIDKVNLYAIYTCRN